MKSIASCGLLLAWCGVCLAQGHDLPAPSPYEAAAPVAGPSAWIRYTHNRPECCGPMGGGPIDWDLYFRTGLAAPIAGGALADSIEAGWLWSGGGRSLFYNLDHNAAWVIDLGISHSYHNAGVPEFQFGIPDSIELIPNSGFFVSIIKQATVRTLNRTFANLSLGREYYLVGTAYDGRWCWRAGWDLGGRIGAARLDVNTQFQQPLTQVTVHGFDRLGSEAYGFFAAWHSDVEIPCGCCAWVAGCRVELDQTWTDFQFINANEVWDLNLLLNLGVRF